MTIDTLRENEEVDDIGSADLYHLDQVVMGYHNRGEIEKLLFLEFKTMMTYHFSLNEVIEGAQFEKLDRPLQKWMEERRDILRKFIGHLDGETLIKEFIKNEIRLGEKERLRKEALENAEPDFIKARKRKGASCAVEAIAGAEEIKELEKERSDSGFDKVARRSSQEEWKDGVRDFEKYRDYCEEHHKKGGSSEGTEDEDLDETSESDKSNELRIYL
jgi:hypothetical protein